MYTPSLKNPPSFFWTRKTFMVNSECMGYLRPRKTLKLILVNANPSPFGASVNVNISEKLPGNSRKSAALAASLMMMIVLQP